MTGDPFPLFLETRRVRNRLYAALDRRLWPRDETELYFLLGGLNGLMANAADDLGYSSAAEELIRAGWAYAIAIDHRPLMGYLRSRSSDHLPKGLAGVRAELADRRYQGNAQASELDERIEAFSRETIVHDLHELPSASG
jgi:hypothetical protein